MKLPITVPPLGTLKEATVLGWLRAGGDRVKAGEVLLMIETWKAEVEVESPGDGIVTIVVPAGPDLVPVGTILGYVEEESSD